MDRWRKFAGGVVSDVVLETVSLADTTAAPDDTEVLFYALKITNNTDNELILDTGAFSVLRTANPGIVRFFINSSAAIPGDINSYFAFQGMNGTNIAFNGSQTVPANSLTYLVVGANFDGTGAPGVTVQIFDPIALTFTVAATQEDLQVPGRIITLTA